VSYREENGQIILTMSQGDYCFLLAELAGAMFLHMERGDGNAEAALRFLDRLNNGNPDYRPYQGEKK
jgi:hypothetical protein